MIAVLQRVKRASVTVDKKIVGAIDEGLLIFLGVHERDGEAEARLLADKASVLRIFRDDKGPMNRSLLDLCGAALVVSQFTLIADCRKGRRPSFNKAARPELALPMYEFYCQCLRDRGVHVATGQFGAMMDVSLLNDGPVTIVLSSDDLRAPRKK
jgi:D-tyrosyl-tRNA(Tyr) deacylase